MGKGTIKFGGTNGLYGIDIERDVTTALVRKTTLEQRSLDLADQIISVEEERTQAKSDLDAAIDTVNTLIDAYSLLESPSETALEVINTAVKAVSDAAVIYNEIDLKYKSLVLEKTSVDKEISALETVDATIETAAWCADYTEGLTGDVGTVEIPGERTYLLIRPGDAGSAVYSAARDGILHPAQNGSYAGVWYNWAMFPGWQKWVPQYRRGQITAIDEGANTCTVDILGEVSTADRLNVNYITSSADVPIEYMTCDHLAFTVGDVVLIEFENVTSTGIENNWANPKVIGFIDNPKECPVTFGYRVQPNPGCETADNEECWNGWGAPFDDGGEPPILINPPWGTIESGSQTQSLLVNQGGWKHWRDPETQTWSATSGTIDWQGNGMLCGWFGGNQGSRYRIHGQASWVAYEGSAITVPNAVTGACVREFNGEKYIISVSDTNQSTIVNTTHVDGTAQWQTNVSHGTYDLSGDQNTGSFWLFNAAGTEAIQIREFSGLDPTHSACNITSPVWRRKMKLTVSLRVGGGGVIVPDITIADLGDEMPTTSNPPDPLPTVFTGTLSTACTMLKCSPFTPEPTDIYEYSTPSGETGYGESSWSYKIYDYVGNVEAYAEFWYTRRFDWEQTYDGVPCTILSLQGADCNNGEPSDLRGGTYDFTYVSFRSIYQTYPVQSTGTSTLTTGVRFNGTSLSNVEYEEVSTYTGSGDGLVEINPTGGDHNGQVVGSDNSWDTTTIKNITNLKMAVQYLDLRFGQMIIVKKTKNTQFSDRHWNTWDFNEIGAPFSVEHWAQSGSETGAINIAFYANGGLLNEIDREVIVPLVQTSPEVPLQSHEFNPWFDLTDYPHLACRGATDDEIQNFYYLFQSPQKDPRPMASAGGTSYCVSYVDRWVVPGEDAPDNENVPPIQSVYNNFPITLNIPGTFPNAAPVTPVEPKAGG